MEQKHVTIGVINAKQNSNGKDYLQVSDQSGKHYNVYPFMLPEGAKLKEGLSVIFEGEQSGQYWNVKKVIIPEIQPTPAVVKEAIKQGAEVTEEAKPNIKNRAFALSYAKDLFVPTVKPASDMMITGQAVIDLAKLFEAYLNGGQNA